MTPTERQLYDALLAHYDQAIADAFLAVVQDLRTQADIPTLIASIQSQRLDDALTALHITPAAFDPIVETIRSGYAESGNTAADMMPPITNPDGSVAGVVRFSMRNSRAEQWLTDRSSTLVTAIVDDQRTAIRNALTAGIAAGRNPTDTANDIVGHYDGNSRQRTGGIVGLTAQQEGFARNARKELASGDPSQLQNYLDRVLRDHRFDPLVETAIEKQQPLAEDDIARMVQRYRDRLLKLRGDAIGRTESLNALRAGKYEAYKQAVETGGLSDTSITRTWRTAEDNRVRDTHAEMDGQEVGMDEPFQSPSGALLMFPGDESLGAGAEEIILCRCDVEYKTDFLAAIGEEKASSSGVTFEVAPDPNDRTATAEWNALTEAQKLEISHRVAESIVPPALQGVGASGDLIYHVGGYQGVTNPSMTLRVNESGKAVEVADVLGHALSQDSMMVISPTHIAGTDQTGLIDVAIGAADPATVYDRLYAAVRGDKGEPLVSGHTTENGLMSIMNDTGLDNAEYARRINEALDDQYKVDVRTVYAGFIGKDDYFASDHSSAGDTTATGSSLREVADYLRAEANDRIKTLVSSATQGR